MTAITVADGFDALTSVAVFMDADGEGEGCAVAPRPDEAPLPIPTGVDELAEGDGSAAVGLGAADVVDVGRCAYGREAMCELV
ncbi:hypothetical protein ID866_1524 [Astraeus odoratus]|nr:hypothetical protein ID866_1524 [Astraeus odoratus]